MTRTYAVARTVKGNLVIDDAQDHDPFPGHDNAAFVSMAFVDAPNFYVAHARFVNWEQYGFNEGVRPIELA